MYDVSIYGPLLPTIFFIRNCEDSEPPMKKWTTLLHAPTRSTPSFIRPKRMFNTGQLGVPYNTGFKTRCVVIGCRHSRLSWQSEILMSPLYSEETSTVRSRGSLNSFRAPLVSTSTTHPLLTFSLNHKLY
jgi:hypothetical protein